MQRICRTPELCLALAMFEALTPEQRYKVGANIMMMALADGDPSAALQALFSTVVRERSFRNMDAWAAQLARVGADQ